MILVIAIIIILVLSMFCIGAVGLAIALSFFGAIFESISD